MWDVKIVSLKWFEDSLERGMVLDESLYDPEQPLQNQGIDAWNRSPLKPAERRPKPVATALQRPRKIRRVASVKLGGQTEGIWTDIVGVDKSVTGASDPPTDGTAGGHALPPEPRPAIQEAKSFASDTTLFDRPRSMTQDTEILTIQVSEEQQRRGIWHGRRFFIHGFTSAQVSLDPSVLACGLKSNSGRPKF